MLLVAADAREFSGLRGHFENGSKAGAGVDFARRGMLGGRETLLVANGAGPRLAAEAVAWASQRMDVEVVVSTGYCGALEQNLCVGDIIIALQVYSPETGRRFRADAPQRAPKRKEGTVLSIDHFVSTVKEKQELRSLGAVAVEMEAAGVAEEAQKRGWRFGCVRAVSDTAGEGFDIDFNAARGDDGRFQTGRIVASAMRRPVARIPELYRLMTSSRRAARALGDILAECRF